MRSYSNRKHSAFSRYLTSQVMNFMTKQKEAKYVLFKVYYNIYVPNPDRGRRISVKKSPHHSETHRIPCKAKFNRMVSIFSLSPQAQSTSLFKTHELHSDTRTSNNVHLCKYYLYM